MKRYSVVALVCVMLIAVGSLASARQTRIGIEAGNPSVVLIVRPAPFDFKVGYDFTGIATGGGSNFLHVSADVRLIDSYRLIDFLHIFLSLGAYTQLTFAESTVQLGFGARVPVGLQAFLLNGNIELFLEIVPTFDFYPSLKAFKQWQGFFGITLPLPKLR